ncbi:cytochrome P450, partial [Diaporthe sp. PMI_573]
YFSRQCIFRFEPQVIQQLELLRGKLLRSTGQEAFDVTTAYSCFTTDVISLYSFGESLGLLTQQGWEPNWRQPTYSFLNTTLFSASFQPSVYTLHTRIPNMISRVQANTRSDITDESESIFREILNSRTLPAGEKALSRLSAEAMALLSAGTETTAWTLSIVTFHVLSKPEVLARLSAEVGQAFPDATG